MMPYDPVSLNLLHLAPRNVSYIPKGIHTEAIFVTIENIGKLSLEFEAEILYSQQNGLPYFMVTLARQLDHDTPETGMTGTTRVAIRVNDWIVPLRNEIHVYRDDLFENTFTFDDEGGYLPDLLAEVGQQHQRYTDTEIAEAMATRKARLGITDADMAKAEAIRQAQLGITDSEI